MQWESKSKLPSTFEKILLTLYRGWFHNAAASSMLSQLNTVVEAYGAMEVIRLTPVPVAHL